MRGHAIILLAAFAGASACAPAHVSNRGQVMSLRSSQSSDSFSSDSVSYCNIAFKALHGTADPDTSLLTTASLNNDGEAGEADTRISSERTPKKMQLRRQKLSRTVEL